MIITIDVPDAYVPGLTYKLDQFNSLNRTTLTLDEFVSRLLGDWARHANTKRRRIEVNSMSGLLLSLTPAEIQEIRDKYGPRNITR